MRPKMVAVGILCVAFVYALTIAIPGWREMKRAATHSAAASLFQEIEHRVLYGEMSPQWQVLSQPAYKKLLLEFKQNHAPLDRCPQCHTPDGIFGDTWGNAFQVAQRENGAGGVDTIVWSKGPDGISGTADDIVIPDSMTDEVRSLATAEK